MYALTVTNPFGVTVSSNVLLTVIDTLDHFSWSQIPSPRFINVPFGVSIQARDSINQLFTNFTGVVSLTTSNGTVVMPSVSGNFSQGLWSGSVTIPQAVMNLVLQASDGLGHFGQANAINVVTPPSLQTAQAGNYLLVYWPTNPGGFALESTTNLVSPQWSQIPAQPLPCGESISRLDSDERHQPVLPVVFHVAMTTLPVELLMIRVFSR